MLQNSGDEREMSIRRLYTTLTTAAAAAAAVAGGGAVRRTGRVASSVTGRS